MVHRSQLCAVHHSQHLYSQQAESQAKAPAGQQEGGQVPAKVMLVRVACRVCYVA